jgi:hypothetical protein
MAIANHFYNQLTRKYVALFGTYFNQIKIKRKNNNGDVVQEMIVPISYAPHQKILARVNQDPNLNAQAITLPRMSFEINAMFYDGERKLSPTRRLVRNVINEETGSRNYLWVPSPYNIQFSLYIMSTYAEDAVKIVEQIIPFFNPEYTSTVKLIPDLDPLDIPLVLNDIQNEELYEGDFTERRTIMWTLNFTMRAWYFGPDRERQVIKFIQTNVSETIPENGFVSANTNFESAVVIQPGLTANNEPTTDPDLTINFNDIDFDDNYAVIDYVTDPDSIT